MKYGIFIAPVGELQVYILEENKRICALHAWHTFLSTRYKHNRKGIHLATHDLNNTLTQLAKKSKMKILRKRNLSTKQIERWGDRECDRKKTVNQKT